MEAGTGERTGSSWRASRPVAPVGSSVWWSLNEAVPDWVEVANAISPLPRRRPLIPARVAVAKIQVAVTLSGSVSGLPTERDDSVT